MVGNFLCHRISNVPRMGLVFFRDLTCPSARCWGRVLRGQGLKCAIRLLLLLVVVLAAGTAAAQDATPPGPVTDNDVNRVARQRYCPVRANIPVDVCPTQACAQWRGDLPPEHAPRGGAPPSLGYFFFP